jgi:hypothetical protein
LSAFYLKAIFFNLLADVWLLKADSFN